MMECPCCGAGAYWECEIEHGEGATLTFGGCDLCGYTMQDERRRDAEGRTETVQTFDVEAFPRLVRRRKDGQEWVYMLSEEVVGEIAWEEELEDRKRTYSAVLN